VNGTLPLERILRHGRLLLVGGVAVVVAMAWAYLLAGAGIDMSMAGMEMDAMPWSPTHALVVLVMWWAMMIAMMVPSATPTVLLFMRITRRQESLGSPSAEAWMFLGGYLVAWLAFSVAAVCTQWALESLNWMSMEMASSSAVMGGAILVAAGLYQFTPIKRACLRYCQNPVLFLSRNWRPGILGALRMGLRHGTYCVGCCWFLMGLLFVTGIMNLVWIAAIALYVAFEKLLPIGPRLSTAAGVVMTVSGMALLVARVITS
jgi:predicted metal-binding membrane protein